MKKVPGVHFSKRLFQQGEFGVMLCEQQQGAKEASVNPGRGAFEMGSKGSSADGEFGRGLLAPKQEGEDTDILPILAGETGVEEGFGGFGRRKGAGEGPVPLLDHEVADALFEMAAEAQGAGSAFWL